MSASESLMLDVVTIYTAHSLTVDVPVHGYHFEVYQNWDFSSRSR